MLANLTSMLTAQSKIRRLDNRIRIAGSSSATIAALQTFLERICIPGRSTSTTSTSVVARPTGVVGSVVGAAGIAAYVAPAGT